MIVGCLLRNYKTYKNIVFAPLAHSLDGKFSAIVGPNGVGKSSILEGLDTFFNLEPWTIHFDGKRADAFVAPVFLIRKDNFKSKLNKSFLETISNVFWNIDEKVNRNFQQSQGLRDFLNYRNQLKRDHIPEDYYLFVFGLKHPNHAPYFFTFTDAIDKSISQLGFKNKELQSLHEELINYYSYIYIPVESDLNHILALESLEIQEMMSKDVIDEIDNILKKQIEIPRDQLGRTSGPKTVKTTVLNIINESLGSFVNEVNDAIQDIDSSYSFSTEKNAKKNLTAADVRETIIDEFLSIRTLKKDKRPLRNLSSGEQRIALIDIAYSLLKSGKSTNSEVIFAIDEPESSLHVSQCFKQFMRVSELAQKFDHQVLVTSHWYGFVPALRQGSLIYISENEANQFTTFSLRTASADLHKVPEDISLKSFFDLATSIIGLSRSEGSNWLIVEGATEQIYFEYFLHKNIENLNILPVGGAPNVIKLYDHLYLPISDKKERKGLSGKIACLIDTDPQPLYPACEDSLSGNKLSINRLQIEENGTFKLYGMSKNSMRNPTAIEDLLDADLFFNALKETIEQFGNDSIKETFPLFSCLPRPSSQGSATTFPASLAET